MIDLGMIVNMGMMLLVTIIAILLVGYFSKKYKIFTPSSGQGVELIGGISIGKKNKLVLIEVLDKKILLGVSDQQINTLCVFDQTEKIDPKNLRVTTNE